MTDKDKLGFTKETDVNSTVEILKHQIIFNFKGDRAVEQCEMEPAEVY